MSITWSALCSLVSLGSAIGVRSDPPVAQAIESSSWYAKVTEDIRHAEYEFRPAADGPLAWTAPNRSQGFRGRASQKGMEVFPRETSADGADASWRLHLRTTSFGRVGDPHDLEAPSISALGARIELDHGLLQEWFENGDRGLEQGWTIAQRPRGTDPLWIGLEIGGDLSLRIDEGARSGALVDAAGEVRLRYRDLWVFDASGRELGARLAPSPAGVGIQIDDAGAVYPLTVDPLLTGPAWTSESDQAGAGFGVSVATAGDVNGDGYSDVIIGAYQYDNPESNEGRAYVYLGSGNGLAASPAWTAESDQASASFGLSVATAGDVNGDGYSDAIVGAPGYDNPESSEGRAYVYLGSPSGLAASPAWTAESNQVTGRFGNAVATAGDVNGDGYSDVIVGANQYDNLESNEGRAYVYLGSAGGLSASPAWTAESDQVDAFFGSSVGTAGDVNGDSYGDVIVGAYGYDNSEAEEGRAYLYLGSASGLAASPTWTAESNQVGAFFGSAAATAGDVDGDGYSDVIVGAFNYDNPVSGEGRAYLYRGSASGLAASPAWTASSDQAGAFFGTSVATAGDVNGDGYSDVIVGASGYGNPESDEGRAYVYFGSTNGLAASPAWTAESDQASAEFGYFVATAGDVNGDGYSDVIVGAYGYDNPQSGEGRAYLYRGSASGLAASPAWTAESNQFLGMLGYSVATAGDVNGDGYSDVIVGAPRYSDPEMYEGRAYLYLGSASGLAVSSAWTAESDQTEGFFGGSVATAGDVNGDGYSDVIIGAQGYDNPEAREGRAYVYLGSASGLAASPAWTAESNQADAFFGSSVATAGDVNGDGYSDAIIGAHQYANPESSEGRAYLYLGSASGLAASPAWTAESNQVIAKFGISVATAGDVNGDGYSDVIVGAYEYSNPEASEGRAYVYLGSAGGLAASPAWTAESNQADAFFGSSVATAGDVNGDGYSDVIVGADDYSNPESDEGRAYVYLGSASGPAASPAWTAESNLAFASFGSSVATAGDVNGDGYSDVIVGAPQYIDPETYEGRAYLYLGSASGLAANPAWTVESNHDLASFGASVATAGDVNGDGYSDAIVGAFDYSNPEQGEGRAFVYLGNEGGGGWTRAHQQRQANDASRIDLLGRSGSKHDFRIQLALARGLAGFRWAGASAPKVRLQWEVAPLLIPLDGSSIESGVEQTITGLPLVINELVGFEEAPGGNVHRLPTGPYHWRARLRTNNPILPVTPWITIQGNNETETKLQVRRFPPISAQ